MEEYDKVEALARHFKDVLEKKSLNPIIVSLNGIFSKTCTPDGRPIPCVLEWDLSKKCTPDDRQRTYKHTEHFNPFGAEFA